MEFACGAATLRLAEGDAKEALRFARVAIAGRSAMSVGHMSVKEAVVVGLEAASSLDDRDTLAELLEMIRSDPLGRRLLFYQAHVARFEARSPTRGEDEVERLLKSSIGAFREIGFPFWMAVAPSSTGSGSMPGAARSTQSRSSWKRVRSSRISARAHGSTGRVGSMKEPRFAPEWIGASGT